MLTTGYTKGAIRISIDQVDPETQKAFRLHWLDREGPELNRIEHRISNRGYRFFHHSATDLDSVTSRKQIRIIRGLSLNREVP